MTAAPRGCGVARRRGTAARGRRRAAAGETGRVGEVGVGLKGEGADLTQYYSPLGSRHRYSPPRLLDPARRWTRYRCDQTLSFGWMMTPG